MPVALSVLSWLQLNYLELAAVITGLLYVIFTIRENILLWFFGIVSSALYVWIFFRSGIFAYSLLYIYYVIIGFYGWYNWSRKPSKQAGGLRIRKAPARCLWSGLAITLILVVPLYLVLKKFSSDMALIDALLTSGGFVATWMLTQKWIEQWLFWIAIDLLSMGVMIYKELYPSALLFLVYALLAIKGYMEWKNEMKLQTTN